MTRSRPQQTILAIASGGGHWFQLMRLRPAFENRNVCYMNTLEGLAEEFGIPDAQVIPDCNRNAFCAILRCSIVLLGHMIRRRPDIVISTGALPGAIAITLGYLSGARTIWIDSVANAEEMSLSGKFAHRVADLCLSQWEHVAEACGAEYAGAIL